MVDLHFLKVLHQLVKDILGILEIHLQLIVSQHILLCNAKLVFLIPFAKKNLDTQLNTPPLPGQVHLGQYVIFRF